MSLPNNRKSDDVYKLDQFFTKVSVADMCIKEVESIYPLSSFDLIIEPSAGAGSFVNALPPNKLAIEIDPILCAANPTYLCQSFFDYKPTSDGKILVIGNPPFGTQNKLSIGFFNHAAQFADVIAFIIPKTWNKTSVHNRLNNKFNIVKSMDLPKDCFYGGKLTSVKCCFQIWKRGDDRLKKNYSIIHKDWDFLPYVKIDGNLIPPDNADFVILAYGSNPGQMSTDLFKWRPKSVHFIKSKIDKNDLIIRFKSLNYSIANNSARQSSLCKADLVKLYSEMYGD